MALNTSDRSSTRSERFALPGPHTNRAISDCLIAASERGRGCSTATADSSSAERSKNSPTRMHDCQRCDCLTLVDISAPGYGSSTPGRLFRIGTAEIRIIYRHGKRVDPQGAVNRMG